MELTIDTAETANEPDIVAALEHILGQPDFLAAPRLSCFLRFVVTETLAGRADRLKAFTIASMALGHSEKFNPKTNSLVRVHAGRLRQLLEHYYKGAGRFERCEIRLPRGSYAPEFLVRSSDEQNSQAQTARPDARPRQPDRAGDLPVSSLTKSLARRPNRSPVIAAIVLGGVIALGLGVWMARGGFEARSFGGGGKALPSETVWAGAGATITVDPIEGFEGDSAISTFTSLLEKRLEDALSGFDNPVVLHRSVTAKSPSDLDYHLSGRVTQAADGNLSLSFRIWHPASGEIVWTRTFDDLHLAKTKAFEPTVGALTSAVAQTYGVLFTDMRKRLSGEPDGFGCIILASDYFKTPSTAAHAAARACLERTLAQHPAFAPGFSALSYLLVDTYLNGVDARPDEQPLDLAIRMAHRAVDLAPDKAHPHAAVFLTRFFDKRFEDAFDSAEQALQLNPYATDMAARIGAAYVLRGEFDKGMPLLQSAVRFNTSPSGWYEFYYFLDAHMRGDDHAARRHALRRTATRFPLGILARIIVAHEQGDTAAVTQWTDRLFADYPTFANDVPAAFERYAMVPEIGNRLLADLRQAGFPLHSQ